MPPRHRPSASPAPLVEHPSVHQAHGGDFRSVFRAPGEAEHAPAADPLHHPLAPVHRRANPAVAGLDAPAPAVEPVSRDIGREGDHARHAVDGGDPEVDGAAEIGVGQHGATLGDAMIGLGPVAVQPSAVEAAETGLDLIQTGTGLESMKLEGAAVAGERQGGRSVPQRREGQENYAEDAGPGGHGAAAVGEVPRSPARRGTREHGRCVSVEGRWSRRCQTLRTLEAWSPLGPSTTSNSTLSPSDSDRKPSAMMAVWCTNTSFPPSCAMKPNPFASLNHLTVPFAIVQPLEREPEGSGETPGLCGRVKTP